MEHACLTMRMHEKSSIKIGLDAHYLSRHEGNRTYVRNLLLGLARVDVPDWLEIVAYSFAPEEARLEYPAVDHRLLAPEARWVRIPISAPLVQLRDRLALWHGTWMAAPWSPCPVVLTVHDVLFATHPHLFPALEGWRMRTGVGRALRRARHVIVPSEASRASLLSAYPFVDPARVSWVPLGIDTALFAPHALPDDEKRRAACGAPAGPYLLAVGRVDPRKNLAGVMRALARARPGERGIPLLLAGPLQGAEEHLRRLARAAGLSPGRVVVVADPDDATLAALYRGCAVLCFPTLAEGVGLPPLEALACGVPALVSGVPSVRETCGDAACYAPAGDLLAYTRRLEELLEDRGARARARKEGPARVARFSLEAMARETLEVYRAALAD